MKLGNGRTRAAALIGVAAIAGAGAADASPKETAGPAETALLDPDPTLHTQATAAEAQR